LDIDSEGGYINVMEKMRDTLIQSGKTLKSFNSGLVASCATVLFMLPEKENRTYYPKNGDFIIHNPWSDIQGDANELLQEAIELKELENMFALFYSEKTGVEVSVIKEIMKQNESISGETVGNLGFATLGIENKRMAFVAREQSINLNKKKMNKIEELLNEIDTKISRFMKGERKMIVVNEQGGTELTFPDAETEAEIAVGSKIEVGGAPANGEYILADNTKIVAVDGVVTEMIPEEKEDEMAIENAQLKEQIAQLEAEKMQLSATVEEKETALNVAMMTVKEIETKFNEVKKMSSNFKPSEAEPKTDEPTEKKFTFKRK
jgi:hypothetical protein